LLEATAARPVIRSHRYIFRPAPRLGDADLRRHPVGRRFCLPTPESGRIVPKKLA